MPLCPVGPWNRYLPSIQGREIEVDKVMGKWYVIGVLPTPFEKEAHNAVEIYTWNAAKNRVDVDFTFNYKALDGPVKSVPQCLRLPDYPVTTSGRWKAEPYSNGCIRLDYIVMDLAEDYSWIVVGHPGRSYLWIMSKSTTLDKEIYDRAVALGKENGFPVENIYTVPHSPSAEV